MLKEVQEAQVTARHMEMVVTTLETHLLRESRSGMLRSAAVTRICEYFLEKDIKYIIIVLDVTRATIYEYLHYYLSPHSS